MRRRRLLLLLLCALGASTALARPRMIPIESSFIGAAASSNPESFLRVDSKVFFAADDGTHGQEPWVTDGTPAGTVLLADINQGSGSSYPLMLGSIGGAAIFTTVDAMGTSSLWRSDGTAGGTIKLMTIPAAVGNTYGYYVATVAADTSVFMLIRQNYSSPVEFLVTDGTVAGTQDLGTFPVNLIPNPIGANGNLYFVGQDDAVGAQLWVSDGTIVGTHMVRREVECPGSSCGPVPTTFFRIGPNVMFRTGDGIWKTDGSGGGTQFIASIASTTQLVSSPTAALAWMIAADGTLWKIDGSGTVTQQAATIAAPSYPFVLDDGRLVFFLRTTHGVLDVWKSDGTAAGTLKIGNLPVSSQGYWPQSVGTLAGRVFLQGWTETTGTELWMADLDSGTVSLLKDIDPRIGFQGASSSLPGPGIALGSMFLFSAADIAGRELWRTDGTAAGTKLLANIAPDPGGGVVSGTVRAAAGGTPIAAAYVYLCATSGNGPCDDAVTDANGHYHFDGVIPGTYTVASNSYIHVLQYYDGVNCPCPGATFTPVTVSAGLETAGIDFSLIRGGTIAGNIKRASTGQAMPETLVLIRNSSGSIVAEQYTDYFGNYQSRGLVTGTYHAETLEQFYYDGRPAVDQVYRGRDCAPAPCDWKVGDGISVTNGVDGTGIDFSLHEYGTIAGTVRDDTGTPVSGFGVSFIRQSAISPSASATTDANGNYLSPLLSPGSYYVAAGGVLGFNVIVYPNGTCPRLYNCTPAGGTLVPVTVDGATTGIDLQLTLSQSRLAGTIHDRSGAPFSGIMVELRDTNGAYISAYGGPATTDANGHYELDNIPAGTYYLSALDELYPGVDCFDNQCSVAAATPLVLTTGHTSRADMQLLSQRTTVSGRLLDAVSGLPISGVGGVGLVTSSGYFNATGVAFGGPYQITTVSRDTAFYLAASAAGHHGMIYRDVLWECSSTPCSLPAGATPIPAGTNTNIDFHLQRTGAISGTVTDAATGRPIQNVEVLFKLQGGSQFANTFTDANGHYTTNPLPGQYNSYATPSGFTTYQPQVYRDHTCASVCDPTTGETISVTDGVETSGIDFHLAPSIIYGTISGHVVDAVTGLPMSNVYIGAYSPSSMSARTDGQGFYSIASTLPGDYALYAAASPPYFLGLSGGGNCADYNACLGTGTPVHVTATKTTTVDFRMIKLRVTSVSPSYGPAAGGTRIVISGANFTSSATVTIGGKAVTMVSITPAQITGITAPSTVGAAHVTVSLSFSLSATFAQGFTYLPTATFTDDPLAARVTIIKAAHILELRAAVNRLRAAALLSDFPFTDPTLSGGFAKAVHIVELRTALDQARAALGLSPLSYGHAISPGTAIRAIDIAEIRNGVR